MAAAHLDPESFRAAAARWLVDDEVQVVVVGPASQLAPPLAAAGYVAGRALPPVAAAAVAPPAAPPAPSEAAPEPTPGAPDAGR